MDQRQSPVILQLEEEADGPTAGTDTVDPLEFLARVTAHIPNNHQVMTR